MDDNIVYLPVSRPDRVALPHTLVNADTLAEALAGLSRQQKTLPAKLFYDDAGCVLFRRITELPEYYVTRTERSLLASVAPSTKTLAMGKM